MSSVWGLTASSLLHSPPGDVGTFPFRIGREVSYILESENFIKT